MRESYFEEVKRAVCGECYSCGSYNTERKKKELRCLGCGSVFVDK